MNHYRWQAPGNGKIFDKPLGEASYMNTRSISVLHYIAEQKKVSQAQFEREIKEYLALHTEYEPNDSTPAHFFRPLLFLGFLKMSTNKVIELSLEGEKFLHFYERGEYTKCKKYILNQLDNSTYPNIATKEIKLQIFPFRILFKLLLLEKERGLSKEFIKEQLIYLRESDDLALYMKTKDIQKIKKDKEYDKFYTWVVNSLLNIEILSKRGNYYFIAEDLVEEVEILYANISFDALFFHDETLLCQLDKKVAQERYKRDARLIAEAKERDGFYCVLSKEHKTFLSKGQNYVEGHHIIPMFQQKNYLFNLDDVDNIISLCPNCHREIHSSDDKKDILTQVYKKNQRYMKNNGVSVDDLYKMYLCS
jgi:5-methylcytosine-specific restriction protein A